jgi:hypothetical protein
MALVKENQGHRWKEWLGEGSVRRILEDAAEEIAWAWGIDKKDSRSYPVNTAETLYQIKERIKECLEPRKPIVLRKPHRGIVSSSPSSFSDLIYDRTVKVVYEDQNAGTYQNALQRAASGDGSTFRKILRAIEHAYAVDQIGPHGAPAPKVQFFHRKLLEIVKVAGINDLKDEGILEFLDDLCPCGEVHERDAIRKLRKRSACISNPRR